MYYAKNTKVCANLLVSAVMNMYCIYIFCLTKYPR